MTKNVPVTVIIVNYNGGEWIIRCLRALRNQTFTQFDVIVVDNGSHDGSNTLIAQTFPEVGLIASDVNLGFAAAVNRALQRVATPWFALLNPDAIADPFWLEELIKASQKFPDTAAFGSQLLMLAAPDRLDGIGDAYSLGGRAWRIGHGRKKQDADDQPREIFSPCAAAALYHTATVRELGGMDEALFCYLEDVDLGFRLRLAGHRCRYVPTARVYHAGSAIAVRHSDFQTYYGQRNLFRVFVKNMPSPLFWLLLPCHLAIHAFAIFALFFQGRGMSCWRAKKDAVLALPSSWRARRQTQQLRKAKLSALLAHLSWRL